MRVFTGIYERFFSKENRPLSAAGLGAVLGLILAFSGLFENVDSRPGADDAALVNHVRISRARYGDRLRIHQGDKERALTRGEKEFVLERIIEEELLVQKAVELGLLESSPLGRSALIQTLMSSLKADFANDSPDEAVLLKFYRQNKKLFQRPSALHLSVLFFEELPGEKVNAKGRANAAFLSLGQGGNFQVLKKSRANIQTAPLPETLLPLFKIREYLGPQITQAALALKIGEISPPLKSDQGYYILRLENSAGGKTAAFLSIKTKVENEFIKKRDNQSFKSYLKSLKTDARIVRGETL